MKHVLTFSFSGFSAEGVDYKKGDYVLVSNDVNNNAEKAFIYQLTSLYESGKFIA